MTSVSPVLTAILCMAILSCSGQRPDNLGINDGRLAPCPATPNCVCSDGCDPQHQVQPFRLKLPAAEAWEAVKQVVQQLPRTRIISQTDTYLHAECSSMVLGFVDDLELHLRPADNVIAVRSASRLGYSDFGVNRKRIETLHTRLQQQNIIN